MKYLKNLSASANSLRYEFQEQVVIPYIKDNGSLKGYKGQIYLILPKYNQKLKLYRGIPVSTYRELYNYLYNNQSQRKHKDCRRYNNLEIVRNFANQNFDICYSRVWHSGVTVYSGEHWKAQALALRNGIGKYGFTYYERDYNFPYSYHQELLLADKRLVSIYDKILEKKLGK